MTPRLAPLWRNRPLTIGALLATLGTILAAILIPQFTAHADDNTTRADLRPNCQWVDEYTQRCPVHSASMDRNIPIVVRPAYTANNPKVIDFLSGMYLVDNGASGYLADGHVIHNTQDLDTNIVLIEGDNATFDADWSKPTTNGKAIKYTTFITEEVPQYLQDNFGIPDGGKGHTGLVGLSMGAYGALSLAAQRPKFPQAILAMSGFYDNMAPFQRWVPEIPPKVDKAIQQKPYQSDAERTAANPSSNIDKLTMPITITSSAGVVDLGGWSDMTWKKFVGNQLQWKPMEQGSNIATREFQLRTSMAGRTNIRYDYDLIGYHAWDTWNRAMWDKKYVQWVDSQLD